MFTDGIGVWRVIGHLVDVIDRNIAVAGTGEDLLELTRRDLNVLSKLNRKIVPEAVDGKIRRVLFYLAVFVFVVHFRKADTFTQTRCDRLRLNRTNNRLSISSKITPRKRFQCFQQNDVSIGCTVI